MPRVIVCDVNETLLDVGALEPHFKQLFGDSRVLQDWFANVLLYSEVATLAGPYSDFASIGGAALDMVASARGITLSSADRSRILLGNRRKTNGRDTGEVARSGMPLLDRRMFNRRSFLNVAFA